MIIMKRIAYTIACLLFSLIAKADNEIEIVYSGNTATVTIPETITDVVCTSGTSADVVLTSSTTLNEYTYKVSGTSTNGSLYIAGSYKFTLVLAGVNLASQSQYAMNMDCGKRIAVVLEEGSVNTLSDASEGTQSGAFVFKGHPEFEGGGTLNVAGNTKHAITAKEYIEFKKSLGTINILKAVGDGLHCNSKGVDTNNYFLMNGGILNINNVGGDGIDCDAFGYATINGGNLSITVSEVDMKCIKAEGDVTITGGALSLNVSGEKCKGISSKANISLDAATIDMTVNGNGATGLKATGNITHTSGPMTIYACGPDVKAYNADGECVLNQDELYVYRAPWRFSPFDYQYDMTVLYALKMNGEIVSDLSNIAVGSFVNNVCTGVAYEDYLRVYSSASSGSAVTFKAYDYSTLTEYVLVSEEPVTFSQNKLYGTYSSPIILSAYLLGDANLDGSVDVRDIVAVVNYLQSGKTEGINLVTADANGDGNVTAEDISGITQKIVPAVR